LAQAIWLQRLPQHLPLRLGSSGAISVASKMRSDTFVALLLAMVGAMAATEPSLRGSSGPGPDANATVAAPLEMPDVAFPDAHPGPYDSVPPEEEALRPRAVLKGWPEVSSSAANQSLELHADSAWPQTRFCDAHHVGYFCSGTTRVRCCRANGKDVQCGTTANATTCDLQSLSVGRGSLSSRCGWPWILHPHWHTSSFCTSHHVGSFCSSHTRIHCCNDCGHYVECNYQYHDRRWC